MAKRKYNKKSEYWKQFQPSTDKESLANITPESFDSSTEPILAGDPYYTQTAEAFKKTSKAYDRSGSGQSNTSRTTTRMNSAFVTPKIWKYANIREGMLPYYYTKLGADVRDCILLCQKAYANIPIFRNVIDIMSEFANTELYIEGGTEKSRNFIDKWFQKIKIWNLKDQFFREYYRHSRLIFFTWINVCWVLCFKNISKTWFI